MRVLLTLASSSRTGPAERMLGDAEQLRAQGHEVELGIDTFQPGNLREVAAGHGFRLEPLVLSRRVRPGHVLDDLRALRRLLPAFGLVHAHFAHDHLVCLWASRELRSGIRIVRAVETSSQFTPSLARRWAYRHTDGFEVSTAERKRWMEEHFGIPADRVAILPGAVDADRFSPASGGPGRLRQALGLGPRAQVIGMVARLKPERQQSALIAAFAALRPRFPEARLVFIGRGEGEAALREEVRSFGLGDAASFAGYWQGADLVEAYRGLDVAVWLSEGNDGTSRAVLEAMAVGLAVVAGRRHAMIDLIEDGRTGLLVEPNDVPALTGALEQLLEDPAQRRRLGSSARERVVANHTWERRGQSLVAFYQRLLRLPSVG
jgi:glycosyltransferase involved in cell wall biosynthesis